MPNLQEEKRVSDSKTPIQLLNMAQNKRGTFSRNFALGEC